MKKLLISIIFIFLVTTGISVAGSFPDGPNGPNIYIYNNSSLPDSTLKKDLPYFQLYADQVCAAWHCSGTLHILKKDQTIKNNDWLITILDESSEEGVLGQHTEIFGTPSAEIYINEAAKYNWPWTDTLTHELAEMLVDPEAQLTDLLITNTPTGAKFTFYFHEICDPVQGKRYKLGPILVADFVYRPWFQDDAFGPFDATRSLDHAFSVTPQGYFLFLRNNDIYAVTKKDTVKLTAFHPRVEM